FLLGIFSKRTKDHEAMLAATIGVLVIIWMTFSGKIPEEYAMLRSPFHKNMIIVIGTLSIFLTGVLFTKWKNRKIVLE
ncbi:sodium:solute symporter, partial [Flavitalea flava]